MKKLNTAPAKKENPKPTKAEKAISQYFELELLQLAVDSYGQKQYLKSAMISWSFIEEFFLPTSIISIAKKQKLSLKSEIIENSTVAQLIKYYYLISFDEELFLILNQARVLRNKLVHKSFDSGSVEEIEKRAKASAKYNLDTLITPVFQRLKGEVVPPSLLLYNQGWNDAREKMISNAEEALGVTLKR